MLVNRQQDENNLIHCQQLIVDLISIAAERGVEIGLIRTSTRKQNGLPGQKPTDSLQSFLLSSSR